MKILLFIQILLLSYFCKVFRFKIFTDKQPKLDYIIELPANEVISFDIYFKCKIPFVHDKLIVDASNAPVNQIALVLYFKKLIEYLLENHFDWFQGNRITAGVHMNVIGYNGDIIKINNIFTERAYLCENETTEELKNKIIKDFEAQLERYSIDVIISLYFNRYHKKKVNTQFNNAITLKGYRDYCTATYDNRSYINKKKLHKRKNDFITMDLQSIKKDGKLSVFSIGFAYMNKDKIKS